MFKIGDLVEVHNPDLYYTKYKNKIGKIRGVPGHEGDYYSVVFSDDSSDAFNDHELRPAKNQIVLNILNDL